MVHKEVSAHQVAKKFTKIGVWLKKKSQDLSGISNALIITYAITSLQRNSCNHWITTINLQKLNEIDIRDSYSITYYVKLLTVSNIGPDGPELIWPFGK